jgi:hypothetical protein
MHVLFLYLIPVHAIRLQLQYKTIIIAGLPSPPSCPPGPSNCPLLPFSSSRPPQNPICLSSLPPLKTAPLLLLLSSLLSSLSLLLTLGSTILTRGMGVCDLCCQICNNDDNPPPPPLLCPPLLALQPCHILCRCPRPAGGGPSLPWKILPPQLHGLRSCPPMLVLPPLSSPLPPPPLPSLPLPMYCRCHCCCCHHCLC